jgi:acyl-CoA synthetase (AMP-forming)/AMP-acid ligase II
MGWPHFGKAIARHADFPTADLSRLRGGNLYELLDPAHRPPRPELRSNALGMTETCGVHCMANMDVDLPERFAGVFGKPMPGIDHQIVDPESGERLPPGETGEICVRGPSVMQGICKSEREESFDREGFFHTGDLGHFDGEGWLHFSGRSSDVIKTGGANVSAREVELLLAEDPAVKAAYVVGLPDEERGAIVAAAVVAEEHSRISPEALQQRVRQSLAAYKVPKFVTIIGADEVPLKDTGKIDRRGLADIIASKER